LAVRQRRLARQVVGYVRRAGSVAECERQGAVDRATRNLREAVSGADLIVLCTPLAQMRPLLKRMLGAVARGAIVTDVGSVKASVVRELEPLVAKAGAHFIGSHPMAGSEQTGVSAARSDLFVRAACVVTPTRRSNRAALRRLERFWKAAGARVLRLTPKLHDELVSRSSHLPLVAAVTLANLVLHPANDANQAALCASGFRDATRIASGSTEMWRDIALANRRNLDRSLGEFMVELLKFRQALKLADAKAVSKYLKTARKRRDDWCESCAAPSPE
jgi:prephenate dehydrogenase